MTLTTLKSIWIAAALAAAIAMPAQASLGVFACEPEWGALATEIGGDKVSVYTATTGRQDPHQIQARPSLIAKARAADVAVCTGAELEIGWLPAVLEQAANPKLSDPETGQFEAARFVTLRDKPSKLDRSEGDIHAEGNPHIQTDPRNVLAVSQALAQRFARLDPANAAHYAARQVQFAARFTAAIARWEAEAASLRGQKIVVLHKSWIYLEEWLGLKRVIALEPKPGVPASSGYIAQALSQLQAQPAKMILHAAFEDGKSAEFVSERTKIPVVVLPFTVGGNDEARDLFSLYDDTIRRLKGALKP